MDDGTTLTLGEDAGCCATASSRTRTASIQLRHRAILAGSPTLFRDRTCPYWIVSKDNTPSVSLTPIGEHWSPRATGSAPRDSTGLGHKGSWPLHRKVLVSRGCLVAVRTRIRSLWPICSRCADGIPWAAPPFVEYRKSRRALPSVSQTGTPANTGFLSRSDHPNGKRDRLTGFGRFGRRCRMQYPGQSGNAGMSP